MNPVAAKLGEVVFTMAAIGAFYGLFSGIRRQTWSLVLVLVPVALLCVLLGSYCDVHRTVMFPDWEMRDRLPTDRNLWHDFLKTGAITAGIALFVSLRFWRKTGI